jgi:putative ABC transport system ATP-binding protein
MKKQAVINLEHITKDYVSGDVITKVLKGINLKVEEGDFIAITGRSGSGKSTMMNIIGLLDIPTNGDYFLNGQRVNRLSEDRLAYIRNKEIGFVFQSFNLLARSNALENVILPATYAGISLHDRTEKAKNLLIKLGMEKEIYKRPNQMSGGQQQRVAIARALMNDPKLILADEPTGNLDTSSGDAVMSILKELNKEGKTIVLITHESDIAKQAKKIIHLADGLVVKDNEEY